GGQVRPDLAGLHDALQRHRRPAGRPADLPGRRPVREALPALHRQGPRPAADSPAVGARPAQGGAGAARGRLRRGPAVSPRGLLTSLEPFGGLALNSSLEVGKALAAAPPAGVQLHWHTLPVVAGSCVEKAWELVERTRPALVLLLGQSAGASAIRVEDRA